MSSISTEILEARLPHTESRTAVSVRAGLTAASPNLDFLRALAVMFVFVDHLLLTHGIQRILFFSPADLGRVGVYFFFVHTSLVLLMSLERTQLSGIRKVLHFYLRRMFRIYPLAIFFVLLVYLCNVPYDVWGAGTAPHDVQTIVANLLLAQNVAGKSSLIGPLWSLPLEVQMYLLLPLVFFVVQRISRRTLLLLWAAATLSAIVYLPYSHSGRILWRLDLILFVPCFLGGAVAYQLARRAGRPLLPGWLWPLAITAVLGVYLAFERERYGWLACLLLGLSVPFFSQIDSGVVNRLASRIATYSYGIYLSNIAILWFAFRVCSRWLPEPATWAVFVLCALIVPAACFYAIERPLMRLGGRLADRLFTPQTA